MLNRQNEARAQNVDEQGAENSATALARKVSFLSRPDSYVPAPETVVTRETHMSWVFMAGERAYKLKKPVRFSFNKKYQISATSMWVWSSRQAYHVSSRPWTIRAHELANSVNWSRPARP
jgi:hypothetical protein